MGLPTKYYIDWDATANAALLVDQPTSPYTFSASGGTINTIVIPANVPAGTYSGFMYASNEASCEQRIKITIIINPIVLPTIALNASAEDACIDLSVPGNTVTTLGYSSTTGDPVTYSIVWDVSPINNFVAVIDAALPASPITIAIPAGTVPDTYTGTLTVKNASGAVSSPGSTFTVTVDGPAIINTIGIINPVVTSSNSQNAELEYSGVTGNPTEYYINWSDTANAASLVDQLEVQFAFVSSGGVINNIVIPANVPAGTYTGTMGLFNGTMCEKTVPVSITINPAPAPTIALNSSAEDVCIDYSLFHDIVTTLGYTGTTGNPTTYSIVWDGSAKRYFEDVTDEMLPSSPITIKPGDKTKPGTYTGTLTVKNANGTVSSPGSVFSVTVNYTPYILTTGTIASVSTSTISQNAELAYTESSENPTIYAIDWDATANTALLVYQGDTPFTFPSRDGIINTIVIPANVPAGTYSGTMYISNGTSCIKSQPVSITINESAPTITLSTSAINVCSNTNEQSAPLDYDATTGNPTVYSIVWDVSPANTFAAVVDEVLQDGSIKIIVPAGTVAGTYTGTLTVKNALGGVSSGTNFTVTVNETPAFVSSEPIAAVYTSTNAQTTTLTYTSSLGGATGYSINWNGAANAALLQDQPLTAHTFKEEGDVIDTIVVSANAQPGTYQGTMILNFGLCKGVQTVSITIEDIPVPTIALGGTKSICNGALSTSLSYKGTTGDPITYSIVWDASPANSFVAVTDATLPSSLIEITIPTGTVSGVYTGTLTVKNAFGTSSLGSTFEVRIGTIPTIEMSQEITSVCSSTNLQYTTLLYSEKTGNPTEYFIDWDDTANNALLADQGLTSNEFIDGVGIIQTIAIPANVPAGTYTGNLFIRDSASCEQYYPVAITICDPTSAKPTPKDIIKPGIVDSESTGNTISVSIDNKVINVNTFKQKINQVSVYDVSGNLLYNRDGVGDSKLSIDNLRSSNQVLLVRVVLDNNRVENKKVIY
ncbi:T9SS sorting signal type C domain-containing protein [Flavobacterium hydatis]|uniref:T9SS sorting signal type C domain-containing protein n=1 Tax=Flavobacterium hydatis TaxID=991 RepID=UPI00339AFA89